jgi:hypothetical protein
MLSGCELVQRRILQQQPGIQNIFRLVRGFAEALRVIKCKAKRGEANSVAGDARIYGRRSLQPPRQLKQGDTKMKKTAYTIIAMLVLVGSMGAVAQAQSVRPAAVRVSIPFQFNVGNTTMPAGDYLIRQLNPATGSDTLQISRRDGSANAIVNMIGAIGNGQPLTKVIFRRYGNQHYFGEVWIDGDKDGLQAPRSKAERGTQKELAALSVRMETVTLMVR